MKQVRRGSISPPVNKERRNKWKMDGVKGWTDNEEGRAAKEWLDGGI